MDSWIHLGEGFSVPQHEKEMQFASCWMPATPDKPIPIRPNSIPIHRHQGQFGTGNWQELVGFPGGYMQDLSNYSSTGQYFSQIYQPSRNESFAEKNGVINHIAGSYTQALLDEDESWNSNILLADVFNMNNTARNKTLSRSVSMAERPLIPNLNGLVHSFGESNSSQMFFANQSHCSSSNLLQIPQYGFPMTYAPNTLTSSSIEAEAAASVTNSFQFAPIIELAKTLDNQLFPQVHLDNQLSAFIDHQLEKNSGEEKDKQSSLVVSVDTAPNQYNPDKLLHNIVDSSSAVISTPFEEPKALCQGGDQVIDLNQTPKQKTPKRRKHRPKVIVEGKPKRTSKAATKESTETSWQQPTTQDPDLIKETTDFIEKPKGKRKYVRKKSLKEPAIPSTDCIGQTTHPMAGTAAPSCRKALSFATENAGIKERKSVTQQEILDKRKEIFNLNIGFHVAESCNETSMMCRTKSNLHGQQNGSLLEIQQSGDITKVTPSVNQKANNLLIAERREGAMQLASRKDGLMDNLEGTGKCTDVRILQRNQVEGIGRTIFQSKSNCKDFEKNELLMSPSTESVTNIQPSSDSRGYTREYHRVEQPTHGNRNPLGEFLWQKRFLTDDYNLNSHITSAECSGTHKRYRTEHGTQLNVNRMPAPVAAVNPSMGKGTGNTVDPSIVQRNRQLFRSYSQINYASSRCTVDIHTSSVTSAQELSLLHKSTGPNSFIKTIGETCNISPPTPVKMVPRSVQQSQPHSCNIDASQMLAMAVSVPSRKGEMRPSQTDIMKDQQSTAKRKGQLAKQKFPVTIEEIIYRMEHLSINKSTSETALVPYEGDGILIPYEGFQFIKKRKSRPKVNLDPETERVWKLLMWKEGGEGLEGTDQKTKQWWEEERRVFQGRADSFIARMHLVQGDRRFSKWKGSVVDSVIGVFLTQNVSDHLSSSAFMHLAAKYPLKSMRNGTYEKQGQMVLVQEPEICMLNQNDAIKWQDKLLSPFHNQSSKAEHKSAEHQRYKFSWTEQTSMVEAHSDNLEEEIFSSQDSFDSSVIQCNGVRSYSGSSSEAEDPANDCKRKRYDTSRNLQQVDNTILFEDFFSHISGRSLSFEGSKCGHEEPEDIKDRHQRLRLDWLDDSLKGSSTSNQKKDSNDSELQIQVVPSSNSQLYTTPESRVLQVENSQLYREESTSSWPSSTSRVGKEKDASCTSNRVSPGVENIAKPAAQQYASERHQETSMTDPHAFLSKQLMHEVSNPQHYHCSQPHEMNKTCHLESEPITKNLNLSDGHGPNQSNYGQHITNTPKSTAKVFGNEDRMSLADNEQTDLKNSFTESNLKEKVHLTNKVNLNTNSSKARNDKAGSVKKDAVDWESLRRQALANGRKIERSKDAMDSLDYEAMRNADTSEISDAIKERGMNNMLAERIKDFLNRLVTEHGSIDLEWLRDINPDKAKDYLLSIRGLGLKSVECVRLLTLHHLAFPVDTNVGRIAVRLGWVPLQPLPESLQLHLLELYPVLESIQKYLWPRLCKLDQRTLYELHYQMITFGKVFCTKSRPNCNACPMRAECRHFASAFASARLALPAPEEMSMVTATVPLTTERSPGIVIDPLPLPAPEDNSLKGRGTDTVSCLPIIEEPATPEQEHTEVIESDIEDIFDEDHDEIPTIKLNMEELTVNLQNYMQANMELQECDMSKALVALNPEAASIPTPKLKNVSRLRTEHQVYELPDSHPLLNGMDKREPDDPSPYLLAIWTPGETANTVQPPERHCKFQGPDQLCNEQTCFSCNSIRESNSQTVRGTLLIPCRTAMQGSFPLNGTYFQVNEVFADHGSSLNPIDVPRAWIWNLPRRMVYFGTSVSTIFKGLSTEGIQYCFWKGFVCVRGFDQKTRAPRPLMARLHFPASKLAKTKKDTQQ